MIEKIYGWYVTGKHSKLLICQMCDFKNLPTCQHLAIICRAANVRRTLWQVKKTLPLETNENC